MIYVRWTTYCVAQHTQTVIFELARRRGRSGRLPGWASGEKGAPLDSYATECGRGCRAPERHRCARPSETDSILSFVGWDAAGGPGNTGPMAASRSDRELDAAGIVSGPGYRFHQGRSR